MPESSDLARRTQSGIQIRPTGLRLRWDLTELATADGHISRGSFTATARALPDPNEIKMLEEALLGSRPTVTAADVVSHFAEAILAAARKYSREMDAQRLLGDDAKQNLASILMESAGAVAFSCGIEILQPAQVDLDCPTLQRQQFEEMDRRPPSAAPPTRSISFAAPRNSSASSKPSALRLRIYPPARS